MTWKEKIRIRIRMWWFIRSRHAQQKYLIRKKKRAIAEADRLAQINNKRHYVLFVYDRYEVLSTIDVNQVNKMLHRGERWDIVKIMKNCVYHTT